MSNDRSVNNELFQKCYACKEKIPADHECISFIGKGAVCMSCESAKMNVVKIEMGRPGNGLILEDRDRVHEEVALFMSEAAPGSLMRITVERMKVTDFLALDEHLGW